MGCPIRILRAHRLYAAPPERFAGLRVLLRLSAPRHPPRTLCSLFFLCLACYVCVCVFILASPCGTILTSRKRQRLPSSVFIRSASLLLIDKIGKIEDTF